MDIAKVHHALIIVIGVGAAAAGLVWEWRAAAVAGVVVVAALPAQRLLLARARSSLPSHPASAQRWLNRLWVTWAIPAGLVAAVPIWLGAELGDQFGTDLGKRSAGQVLGLAIAFAAVELAKALNADGKVIDEWIGRRSKELIENALGPEFDDQEPPGVLPKFVTSQDQSVPSELWLLVNDTANRGWDTRKRSERSERIQVLLDEALES